VPASPQICVRGETPPDMRPPGYVRPTQPRICVIFRGKVGRCSLTLGCSRVDRAWFQRLKLERICLLSNFAFQFNLRPCGLGHAEAAECEAYDPDVDVLWQPKAWSDRPCHRKWISGPWKKHCEGEGLAGGLLRTSTRLTLSSRCCCCGCCLYCSDILRSQLSAVSQ
jgi:hypothetical protein